MKEMVWGCNEMNKIRLGMYINKNTNYIFHNLTNKNRYYNFINIPSFFIIVPCFSTIF